MALVTSGSLIDATTLMLRQLNQKMGDMAANQNGSISEVAKRELEQMLQVQMEVLKTAIVNSSDERTKDIINMMLLDQGNQWATQNKGITDMMNAMATDIKNTIRAANVSPELSNPQRQFTKEGVIETIAQGVRLFFPYREDVVQPPNTCVLRNVKTMKPMMVNSVFHGLVNLEKKNPTRMAIAHGLIPVGYLPAISEHITVDRMLMMISLQNNLPIAVDFKSAFENVRFVTNTPYDPRSPIPNAATLFPVALPKGPVGNYFNATLLLAFASGYWTADEPIASTYVYYQKFFKDILERKMLADLSVVNNVPSFVLFLWRAVSAWNLVDLAV